MKTGSQDISPPKETAQPGLPDEAPNDIESKDALPQEVEPAAETFAPMQLEEAAPAPADKVLLVVLWSPFSLFLLSYTYAIAPCVKSKRTRHAPRVHIARVLCKPMSLSA